MEVTFESNDAQLWETVKLYNPCYVAGARVVLLAEADCSGSTSSSVDITLCSVSPFSLKKN